MPLERYGNQILSLCESTNDCALELAEVGAPHLTFVASKSQTRGRGRNDNTWYSPEGQLFVSFVLRTDGSALSWIPLICALSVTEVLLEMGIPKTGIRIKWPNDLRAGAQVSRKLCGILCEGSSRGASQFVVAGFGLNLVPVLGRVTGVLVHPISVQEVCEELSLSIPLPRELREWILKIQTRLGENLDRARSKSGLMEIKSQYDSLALFEKGTPIEWTRSRDEMKMQGVVVGLGESGELMVHDGQGVVKLFSEEVEKLSEKPV